MTKPLRKAEILAFLAEHPGAMLVKFDVPIYGDTWVIRELDSEVRVPCYTGHAIMAAIELEQAQRNPSTYRLKTPPTP